MCGGWFFVFTLGVLKESGASGVIHKDKESRFVILHAHMNGKAIPLEEVKDEAFASKILGEGVAIEPSEGRLYAPCDGKVAADTLLTEIFLRMGIDELSVSPPFVLKVRDAVRKIDLSK